MTPRNKTHILTAICVVTVYVLLYVIYGTSPNKVLKSIDTFRLLNFASAQGPSQDATPFPILSAANDPTSEPTAPVVTASQPAPVPTSSNELEEIKREISVLEDNQRQSLAEQVNALLNLVNFLAQRLV